MKYSTYMMFLSSILFSLNCNNIMVVWFLLELNMILFIPLHSNQNMNTMNNLMKYFITQSLASLILLMLILMMNFFILENHTNHGVCLVLMLKLGMFPFSSWYFQVTENMEWQMWFLINTLQKIIPIWLISNYYNTLIINTMVVVNSIYSAIEMWSQNSIRWLLNSSSLNHISWMLISLNTNTNIWEMYLIMYCYLSYSMYKILENTSTKTLLSYFNYNLMMKMMLTILLLNFMGMPPMMGFIPKLLIMKNMSSIMILVPLIVNNLLLMFFYMTLMKNLFMKKISYKTNPMFPLHYFTNTTMTTSLLFYMMISF